MLNLNNCFSCNKQYTISPNNSSIYYCISCEIVAYKKPKEKNISSITYNFDNITVLINKKNKVVEYHVGDSDKTKVTLSFDSYNKITYSSVKDKIKNIFLLM